MTRNHFISALHEEARKLGFIACGFSKPAVPPYFEAFRAWLSEGNGAGMSWLRRNLGLREDPARLLEGCRAVVALAYPYCQRKPATPDGFTVARYSEPTMEDYHTRVSSKCRALVDLIQVQYPQSRSRICLDSAPIMERGIACASGLGYLGKNNMLIVPGHGSYLYLAEILTTAPLVFPPPQLMETRCGACTLCVDSCPTGALERPFWLDAGKCLSYLTIEHKGEVGEKAGRAMGGCFFGCDRCQEVCPLNGGEKPRKESLPLSDRFLEMDPEDFREKFGKTAFARAGLGKLKSNIRWIRAQGEAAVRPRW